MPAVVLPFDAGRVLAALRRARFVDTTNGVRMSAPGGDQLLAAIPRLFLIPDDRFQKPLQRSRSHILIQRNGFRILALHAREQTTHINQQQLPPRRSSKTSGEMLQELTE